MIAQTPEVHGIISSLILLIPIFGFSTNSICGGGSRFSRNESDKPKDNQNEIDEIKKEIEFIGGKISGIQQRYGIFDEYMRDSLDSLYEKYNQLKDKLAKLLRKQ